MIRFGDLAQPTFPPDTDAASPPRQVDQRRGGSTLLDTSRNPRSNHIQWLEARRTSESREPWV